MEKKGVGKIIAVILIILVSLTLILIAWNLLKGLLIRESEISEIKAGMIVEQMEIKEVHGDFMNPEMVSVTIRKGPGKVVLRDVTVIDREVEVDIISVTDLSLSMGRGYLWSGECRLSDMAFCGAEGCIDSQLVCESYGGIFDGGKCLMDLSSECCTSSDGCNLRIGCEFCSGTFENGKCNLNENSPCCKNARNCLYEVKCRICNGEWKSKLQIAQEANKIFVSDILSSGLNRAGLVGYETSVNDNNCHELSDNEINLHNKIDSWVSGGYTCICCGINEAVEYLSSSAKSKAIVIMSDGEPNYECTPHQPNEDEAKEDAISSARDANSLGIIVYTVGFLVSPEGEDALRQMALEGGGEYYYASTSSISDIYADVGHSIIRHYELAEKHDHLEIVFYSETDSWIYSIPDTMLPLETKTYEIPVTDITNIIKIEIYPVRLTSSGEEVIGPALDVWEIKR